MSDLSDIDLTMIERDIDEHVGYAPSMKALIVEVRRSRAELARLRLSAEEVEELRQLRAWMAATERETGSTYWLEFAPPVDRLIALHAPGAADGGG